MEETRGDPRDVRHRQAPWASELGAPPSRCGCPGRKHHGPRRPERLG